MVDIPFDLSKLSRTDLEKIFSAEGLPQEIRDEAEMLHDLSDPEGPWVQAEGEDPSQEWTVNVSVNTHNQITRILHPINPEFIHS